MAANLLQIVDDIKASPAVTLDLNNENPYGVRDFQAPPPPLRRSISSTMAWDGDRISASAYSNRTITITLDVPTTSQDLWAASWQTLARSIDKETFLLKYQPTGATSPVFFKCYRADVSQIADIVGATAYRVPTIEIPADPFAYGLPEDVSLTMTNSPVTGTNANRYTFGTIKGDVASPLLISTDGNAILDNADTFILASHALRSSVTQSLLARNLTELTSGTDMGAQVTGAGAQYIDGDYKSCSFATTTFATRLSGSFSTALTPIPGEYRGYIRVVVPTGAVQDFAMTIDMAISGTVAGGVTSEASGTTVTLRRDVAFANQYLVDVGVFPIPFGTSDQAPGLGVPATTTVAPAFTIGASVTVAIPVRFDELFLVPVGTNYTASATHAFLSVPESYTGGNVVLIDGINETITAGYDSTTTSPFTAIPSGPTALTNSANPSTGIYVGGLPVVVPNCTNYLTMIFEGDGTGTWLATTTTLNIRYWPRYLYVRPATT